MDRHERIAREQLFESYKAWWPRRLMPAVWLRAAGTRLRLLLASDEQSCSSFLRKPYGNPSETLWKPTVRSGLPLC